MSDVLDQSEVDALLAAVDDGDDSSDQSEEVVKVFSAGRGLVETDAEIRNYDFKRPERVSKDQMRALETLHDTFSRSFGAALSGFLRTIMEVKVANIEQMTYSEFTHSLPNPTCFNLLTAEPLEGNICLEISPLIIYPIIDRLLGGSNADLFIPQRPLTAIELRLVGKIIDRAVSSLGEVWESVLPISFKQQETESNPALVQIVAPNEVVVVVGFEMKMGGRAGTMSLGIPYAVIEPVMDKLSSQSWAAYKKHSASDKIRNRLANHLEAAKLDVSTILADSSIKLTELMNLQVGDIITTEKPASSPLTLSIGGKRKFIGHLGQYRGNRAFKVARQISPKDRV
ncbi:flagellar motor switch protein FliM [Poriferisphaera sp. WC338]|uniref:flagellar motor switch protein FliM n=1 Tax=Poriferisphaera sp. WC338 TaxID=3425129 RepID=UPI003D81BA11